MPRTIPALGRMFHVGDMYDIYSDTILPGLYKQEKLRIHGGQLLAGSFKSEVSVANWLFLQNLTGARIQLIRRAGETVFTQP